MLKDANFLCEIGTEEIPAGYIPPAIEAVEKTVRQSLEDARIDFNDIEVLATPRRIVILISGISKGQREEEIEMKGPSVKAAYDDGGKPSKALEGFMKANGVGIGDLFNRDTGKGDYVFARKKLDSRMTVEILPDIITGIVRNIPFPKRMRWSDKEVTFPRPISYFLILLNDAVVPYEIDGITSSDRTRGHYIQHNEMLKVGKIKDYSEILRKNGVIVDQLERKEIIRKGLADAAKIAGGILHEDEELLDTVTFLVENPYIVTCTFDRHFLDIPDIVLIAEMREHQKYFSVTDGKGSLTDIFLVVSNNPATMNVKEGNVRVISARFNDARFFYDEDRKMKLADRVDSLKSVLFHKELGSIYDKMQRMQAIAGRISESLSLDKKAADNVSRAVELCKTDLMTAVVYEFPSLQGKIGKIYALNDGEDPDVAEAIEDHYRPRSQGDRLPTSMTSIVLSLSEKLDNIFGSFSVGNIPRGSQDPYALRRQANAIVELLIKNEINISVGGLLGEIADNYRDGKELIDKIVDFISARARTIFIESGFSHDEIDACLSTGSSDYLELYRRAGSINEFRKNEKFSEMLLSFKRMNNIVSAFRKEFGSHRLSFDESLMEFDEERELYDFFRSRSDAIKKHISSSSYIGLFKLLIEGKPAIDRFFDKVLVMEKDNRLRDNRLFILEDILKNFTGLLDFSRIEDKG